MQCAEELEVFLCFLQYRNYGTLQELIRFKHSVFLCDSHHDAPVLWNTQIRSQSGRFLAESFKKIKHVTFGFERN